MQISVVPVLNVPGMVIQGEKHCQNLKTYIHSTQFNNQYQPMTDNTRHPVVQVQWLCPAL